MNHGRSLVASAAAAALLFPAVAVAGGPTPRIIESVRIKAAQDEPGSALEHFLIKRRSPHPQHDLVAAWQTAKRRMDRMPRYSTRLAAALPAEPKLGGGSLPTFIAMRVLGRWSPLGPGNIGGRTRSLLIHPDRPEIMYTAGVSGGIWKTVDGGGSWTALADRIANIAVNSMAMHHVDPEVLYAGTGEGYFREDVRGTWLPLRGAGIFKSVDGGASWRLLERTDTPDFHWVNDLVTSPHQPERLYAATRTGVWRSEDGGERWQRLLATDVQGGCLDLALRTDRAVDWLYASCGTLEQATVYRRIMNSSGDWMAVLSEPGMGRTSLAIAPSDQRIIYALAASHVPGPGGHFDMGLHAVYRSTSGGAAGSWQVRVDNTDPERLNTLLLTNPVIASLVECGWGSPNRYSNMGWYANVIAVDPVDPDRVWAGGVDLFRSDDGGRTWGVASYWWLDAPDPSFVHADQHVLRFHPSYDGGANRTLFAANDGGVFRTDDATAPVGTNLYYLCDPSQVSMPWTSLNHNLGITQFYHGAAYDGGRRYLGGTQDNSTLLGSDGDGHDGWWGVIGGDGGYVAVDPTDERVMYAEAQRFNFHKSIDGGLSWFPAQAGISEPFSNFLFITPFVLDPNDSRRLWSGGRRLWRSDNAAGSWQQASTTLPGKLSAVAVAPGDSQRVVAGTSSGHILLNELALEADRNSEWLQVLPREGFVSWLAWDPSAPDTLYATYADFGGDHVWRSTDGGREWHSIDGHGSASVPDIPVHAIVVDPTDPERLYLGTDLGVLTTLNGGAAWSVENTGFANAVTESLSLSEDDDGALWLFAFTHGRGAWRVRLNPVPPPPREAGGRRVP